MDETGVDLSNRFRVGSFTPASTERSYVIVANPPADPLMDPADALVLAAWLVRCAQPKTGIMFEDVRRGVLNT